MLKFMEKNGKTTHSGIIEAFHAHFLSTLYLMEANMSMRVYLMKEMNVTATKRI